MIDLSKIKYRVVVIDENGNQYNIKEYIHSLGWEENQNEIAVRSSFVARNDKTSKGKLSSLIKPGCLIGIFATDGNGYDEEVARGFVTDWNTELQSSADNLKCTSYDILYNLQKSQDNRFYSSGTGTQSILTELFYDFEIPFQEYHGPNATHGKLKYNNSYVSDMIRDILDDARKKGCGTYILRATKGYVDVVERGSNTDVYVFKTDNTKSVQVSLSTADLITRVRVIGQQDDDGKSSVEATINGLTEYGIKQRIYVRGSDESLEDAKSAAQEIINENGTVQKAITLSAPDVPFIRKGDLVYVIAGTSDDYYYVKGIRHDCESYSMTMELEKAETEAITAENTTESKKEYKEGDIVNFHGGTHYVSSYPDSQGYSARAGKAKITKKNGSGKAHTWHLIHTDSESNVYGWVDDGTFD